MGRQTSTNVSPDLVACHVAEVSHIVADRALPSKAVPFRVLKRAALFCLAAIGSLSVFALFSSPRRALVRVIISPWAETASPATSVVTPQPPVAGNFSVTYRFPAYTGLEPATTNDNPNVTGLAGTVVVVQARFSKAVKTVSLSTSYGLRETARLSDGMNSACQFTIRHNGTYQLLTVATDGAVHADPPEYTITATPDQPPAADILSPETDVVAADDAVVPVVAQLSDDYGLSRAELVCRLDDERVVRFPMPLPKKTVTAMAEYKLKIADLGLAGGRTARISVQVWDNDTVNGPKFSLSPVRTLEITDSSVEHGKIEEGLKELRGSLVDILADQLTAQTSLDALIEQSSASVKDVLKEQKDIRQKLDGPIKTLDSLTVRMNNDPMTDMATCHEYTGLEEQLKDIRDRLADDAVRQLEHNERRNASRDQREMVAGLEKISSLSENIWQYQRMRDLTTNGGKLTDAVSALADKIHSNVQPAELEKALKDIAEMFNAVAAQLQKLPQELPEDFVNQPGIKQINLAETGDLLSRLNEAVSRGEWATAQSLAQQLQDQLRNMMEAMQEAGKDVGFSPEGAGKMSAELQKTGLELDSLVADQEKATTDILGIVQPQGGAYYDDVAIAARAKAYGPVENNISGRVVKVRRTLEEFTRKSTAVPPVVFGSLESASAETAGSARSLEKGDASAGLRQAATALDQLRKAREGLSQAEKEMRQQSGGSGSGAGNAVRMKGIAASRGGISGVKNGTVRLPGADEYRAPRQFRQELLEGLKESYPKKFEKDIRTYFRSLAE